MLVTGAISVATLIFGLLGDGLNQIAPLMTMFFLITYVVLNAVVLLEQSMGLTSFRPRLTHPACRTAYWPIGCAVCHVSDCAAL